MGTRVAIGLGAVGATIAAIVLTGIGTTSALIEIGVFLATVVLWVAFGRAERAGASLEDVRAHEDVEIDQSGRQVAARRVQAGGSVSIKQRGEDR